MKLLFVIEDRNWSQQIQEECQKIGFCCEAFQDEAVAMNAYRQQPEEYSLVIVDFSGSFDGFTFVKKLRDVSAKKSVLAVSSSLETEVLTKAALTGISFFLPKTADVKDLVALLRQINDQLKDQKKEQDEKDWLAKEYIRLRREYGEMQVQLKKYEALLAMQQ